MLTVLAVPLMRVRKPHVIRPYKVWGYPWTIIIATISFLIILSNNFLMIPLHHL